MTRDADYRRYFFFSFSIRIFISPLSKSHFVRLYYYFLDIRDIFWLCWLVFLLHKLCATGIVTNYLIFLFITYFILEISACIKNKFPNDYKAEINEPVNYCSNEVSTLERKDTSCDWRPMKNSDIIRIEQDTLPNTHRYIMYIYIYTCTGKKDIHL